MKCLIDDEEKVDIKKKREETSSDSFAFPMVKDNSTRDELNDEFTNEEYKGKLIVVNFYATWCGPCSRMTPLIDQWHSNEFRERVVFLQVDVDKAENLSQDFKIEAMPTFIFIRNGNEIYRFVGANPILLKSDIEAFSILVK